jgi:hypothetical protein
VARAAASPLESLPITWRCLDNASARIGIFCLKIGSLEQLLDIQEPRMNAKCNFALPKAR